MKKKLMLGFILSVMLLSLPGTTACNSLGGSQDTVNQQLVTVTRGDLTMSVSGKGKIETSREARLTFGSAGKVEKMLIKEGDMVKTGDVLAKLDTSPLELALNQSQMAVTQAEVALTQAQLAQQTAEYNLENTRNSEDTLKLALLNAQIALDTAQNNLAAGITAIDFNTILAELNKAKAWYDYVKRMPQAGIGDSDSWSLALDRAQERLDVAQANYDNTLAGYDSRQVNLKKKQVESAGISVALAQKNIDELGKSIALQELQVASTEQTARQAQQAVDLARASLADSRRQLGETAIYAPFVGVVSMVLAKEGDIIPSPSMAPQTIIKMIDPDSLELVIEVDEIDIPQVKLAQEVTVNVDALPKAVFTGRVTAIYPVPSEVGGVVLYTVRINLDIQGESEIKVGMSASANIVAEKHENVLLVPSRAIGKNEQGQAIVKVKANEQIQERAVAVGLDDGLKAEIISGLNEGETVVVEVRVKSTSAVSLF
jgi:RND family efflux transporter MFP subunit